MVPARLAPPATARLTPTPARAILRPRARPCQGPDGRCRGYVPGSEMRTVTHGRSVGQLKNGKAVHDWIYWDPGHLMRQLGVLPAS